VQVKVSDVDAALKLLDFALYHRELSEVDKRLEEEKEQRSARRGSAARGGCGAAPEGRGGGGRGEGWPSLLGTPGVQVVGSV